MLQKLQKDSELKLGEYWLRVPIVGDSTEYISVKVSAKQLNELDEIAEIFSDDFLNYTLTWDTTYMFSDSPEVFKKGNAIEAKINQVLGIK